MKRVACDARLADDKAMRLLGLAPIAPDIDVPVTRKYSRVTMKARKPEWLICPKCQHVILLREKKK